LDFVFRKTAHHLRVCFVFRLLWQVPPGLLVAPGLCAGAASTHWGQKVLSGGDQAAYRLLPAGATGLCLRRPQPQLLALGKELF